MAVLAHEALNSTPTSVPGATGAKKQVVLGSIAP
ncbi:anhydro-N-acetylmuramic acid kinase [Infirmifilum lucidum]|uniref:Anhydro-N-acetylmuramic acid kinase n=1 Tax=Infirmifilum lucidum TaxID=2776706 RepID=A0A7L9FH12_9CREN|nr:anhydro-N-acetylmuramic acid kinase [Infirmifilum lucidum]QOJ79039.1 anhydro-N-acetylmuramic acid kinase [Infirmifilum lucidum]